MSDYSSILKSNSEIRKEAREHLSGNWLIAIIVCVIAWIFTDMFSQGPEIKQRVTFAISDPIRIFTNPTVTSNDSIQGFGFFITMIIGGPITFGTSLFFLNLIRKSNAKIEDIFVGFKYFGKSFLLNLLIGIFVILWSLLLIIPGIVAAFKYSMAYYILIDNPELSSLEAIGRSKDMMNGRKGKLFSLYLSFIGWAILCILTLGVGFIWLEPYIQTSVANFYENLKGGSNEKEYPIYSEANYNIRN